MMADEVTKLLLDWSKGDKAALEQLIPLVYQELHLRAQLALYRERLNHTLEATELVHEVYLRLFGQEEMQWQDRAHFFAIAAKQMRHVLMDEAYKRTGEKWRKTYISFNEASAISNDLGVELIALAKALAGLARLAPRQCQVMELRCFGGLSFAEAAVALDVSKDTVKREWQFARSWLHQELSHQRLDEHDARMGLVEKRRSWLSHILGPRGESGWERARPEKRRSWLSHILGARELSYGEQEQDVHPLDDGYSLRFSVCDQASEQEQDVHPLDDGAREHKIDRPLPYLGMKSLNLSASRLALYLLASTVVSSILLQLLTDDGVVIFFGTLNLAIINAWIWAWWRKIRLTLQHFKGAQQSRSEQPLLGE